MGGAGLPARRAQCVGLFLLAFGFAALILGALSASLPAHVGVHQRASCGAPTGVALHREPTLDLRLFGVGVEQLVTAAHSTPAAFSHQVCWQPSRSRLADAAGCWGAAAILIVVSLLARSSITDERRGPVARLRSGSLGRLLGGVVLCSQLLLVALILSRSVHAGEEWHYIRDVGLAPVVAFALVAPVVGCVAWVTVQMVHERERMCVGVLLAGGVLLDLLVHRLSHHALGTAIGIDHFAATARQYGATDFLRRFTRIAPTLDLHARANMPGKVLLYDALEFVTRSDETLGLIVVLLSALGAVVAYATVKELVDDRRAAIAAMILYFMLPARIEFLTSLNTVTPVLTLGLLWLALRYVDARAWPYATALGLLTYVTALFDLGGLAPLPLLVTVVVWHWRRRRFPAVRPRDVAIPLAAFLVAYATMSLLAGFDLARAIQVVLKDNAEFYRAVRPTYWNWLLPNLREFFVNAGWMFSMVALALVAATVGTAVGARHVLRSLLGEPMVFLSIVVLAQVALLDVTGATRGEVARLWLFAAVFLPMIVAIACARLPIWVLNTVILATLMQAMLTTWMVRFDNASIVDVGVRRPELFHATALFDLSVPVFLLVVSVSAARRRPATIDGATTPNMLDTTSSNENQTPGAGALRQR